MSKKNRKAWRASVQREAANKPGGADVPPAYTLRGLPRMAFIDKLARELFLAEGGGSMDLHIRTGQLTLDAFESQMLEARDGTKSWGPDVSVYEARMNRALNERLHREKRNWLREIRKRIEAALEAEEAAAEQEAAEQEADQEAEPTPGAFTTETNLGPALAADTAIRAATARGRPGATEPAMQT